MVEPIGIEPGKLDRMRIVERQHGRPVTAMGSMAIVNCVCGRAAA